MNIAVILPPDSPRSGKASLGDTYFKPLLMSDPKALTSSHNVRPLSQTWCGGNAQSPFTCIRTFEEDVAGGLPETRQALAHCPVEVLAIAEARRSAYEGAVKSMRIASDSRRRIRDR